MKETIQQRNRSTFLSNLLSVRIILILLILRAITLTLESADALQSLRQFLLARLALAEHFYKACLLHLLLEAALQAVIGFLPLLDGVDGHK